MFRRGLIFVLCSSNLGFAWASDPAEQWLREDAPHTYLVRQSDTPDKVISYFVRQPRYWERVWCPRPTTASPIVPGDLLIRVRINGRSWVQRARRGDGSFPHAQELAQFQVEAKEPFTFVPHPDVHPVQRIEVNPGALSIHEPEQSIYGEVLEVWDTSAKDQIVRVNQGKRQHVKSGTALSLVPHDMKADATAWRRAVVVLSLPGYSYVLLLGSGAMPSEGDSVRSPMAWCVDS